MSEVKTPIRSLNGHALVDEQARADIDTLNIEMTKKADGEDIDEAISALGLYGRVFDISDTMQGVLPTLPNGSMSRICRAIPHGKPGKVELCFAEGVQGGVQQYTTDTYQTRVSDSGWLQGDGETVYEVDINPDLYGVYVARKINNAEITPDDGSVISAFFYDNSGVISDIQERAQRDAVMSSEIVRSIAHRGSRLAAPENTLPAFCQSKRNGFRWVECDVWWTMDGHAVLSHVDNLSPYGISGVTISENTLETLKTYNLGAAFNLSNVYILTLEEFITHCKKLGLKAVIELKREQTDEEAANIVATVKNVGMLRNVMWLGYIDKIRTYDTKAKIRFLTTLTSKNIDTAAQYIIEDDEDGAAIVVNYSDVTDKTLVHEAIAKGLVVGVYWNNDQDVSAGTFRETISTLAGYGVNEFTTNDYPAGWELYIDTFN